MHVLMLGWEFPPFITGGLGTACHGLTKALDRQGTRVTFVLPKAVDRSHASHVNMLSPQAYTPARSRESISFEPGEPGVPGEAAPAAAGSSPPPMKREVEVIDEGDEADETPLARSFEQVRFIGIPTSLRHAYQRSGREGAVGRWITRQRADGSEDEGDVEFEFDEAAAELEYREALAGGVSDRAFTPPPPPRKRTIVPEKADDYGMDMFEQVERYARFCLAATRGLDFDVIHAHDWMTYYAGLLIAQRSGKPLVVHVHSTEFDRSGEHVHQRIYDIERRGMHGSMRVVAVSQLTKNVIMRRYGIPDRKVEVVYNGVDLGPTQGEHEMGIGSKDKIVLYFGRITYQKGPEYFIAAAKRVLEVMDDVKFVVAGSGDQAKNMIEMAAGLGIGHKVLFTGFLRGRDIQRVFALADLYVMPSVSEPFGIAPLEAMAHDVPALISKSSGVSEVLTHVLKVDFWDIDDMANKIVAVLKYPPLHRTLQEHGAFEVRKITWDGAAKRCEQVYRSVVGEMRGRMAAAGRA